MARSVRLPEELMTALRREAEIQGRALIGQAIHWIRIHRATEESGVLACKRIRARLQTLEQREPSRDE